MTRLRKVFLSYMQRFWTIPVLLFLFSCSGLEHSEQENLRRANAKGEFIHRTHDEYHYAIETPKHLMRERYSWEQAYIGKHAKISKEYFRCKGSSSNPP